MHDSLRFSGTKDFQSPNIMPRSQRRSVWDIRLLSPPTRSGLARSQFGTRPRRRFRADSLRCRMLLLLDGSTVVNNFLLGFSWRCCCFIRRRPANPAGLCEIICNSFPSGIRYRWWSAQEGSVSIIVGIHIIRVSAYVCMCVCMHVYAGLSMYASMHARIRRNACMHVYTYMHLI